MKRTIFSVITMYTLIWVIPYHYLQLSIYFQSSLSFPSPPHRGWWKDSSWTHTLNIIHKGGYTHIFLVELEYKLFFLNTLSPLLIQLITMITHSAGLRNFLGKIRSPEVVYNAEEEDYFAGGGDGRHQHEPAQDGNIWLQAYLQALV